MRDINKIESILQIVTPAIIADIYVLLSLCRSFLSSRDALKVQHIVNIIDFHIKKLCSLNAELSSLEGLRALCSMLEKLCRFLKLYNGLLRDLFLKGVDEEVSRVIRELVLLLFTEREVLKEVEEYLYNLFKCNLLRKT